MTVLLVYASTHGHTAKIAERIAGAMRSAGASVEVRTVEEAGEVRADSYDAVVVAASVHGGAHQAEIVRWAEKRRAVLELKPSAFVSVSLTAAEDTDEGRTVTRGYVDDFVERTGWTPRQAVTLAGALQYREYDFMTRLVMRLLMHRGGHPTDIGRDFDYTDWDAVDRFGEEFARRVAAERVS